MRFFSAFLNFNLIFKIEDFNLEFYTDVLDLHYLVDLLDKVFFAIQFQFLKFDKILIFYFYSKE